MATATSNGQVKATRTRSANKPKPQAFTVFQSDANGFSLGIGGVVIPMELNAIKDIVFGAALKAGVTTAITFERTE